MGLADRTTGHTYTWLTIQAYAYDHRYESAMQTDILRRAHRELRAQAATGMTLNHSVSQADASLPV